MDRIKLLFLNLFLATALVKAQHPTTNVLSERLSFSCSEKYLVVDKDFFTCEVEISGNNSDYTYNEFQWPRFNVQELNENAEATNDTLICEPFTTPQNGFCLKRDIINTTGCSCEETGPQVYRVKTVYRITEVYKIRGRVQFLWPSSTADDLRLNYDLPDVRDSENSGLTTLEIVGIVIGIIASVAGILSFFGMFLLRG
ncbi:hypothetical protein PoB_003766400 [Plakobranchus ocellatus]|uniref:Uncharacterized protein n=1 Tax=Plakobranchus ocellatus TaxID=259542 RepID=A0AAV4AYF1_9GAST|nr:hypothetical protein PoB_003766400 [Plakobranchus ocellatus]